MEAFFPILVFLVIATVILIVLTVNSQQAKAQGDTFARLAAKFGGTAERGGLFQRPSARFVYNGAHVLVDVYSTGGKSPTYYTQVHLNWPDPSLRCEVYPATFFTRIGQFLGMTDIEIGSAKFDDTYQITGNNADAIRELLAPGVQVALESLRRFNENDHIYVLVSGGTMLVKKLGSYRDYESLSRLTVLGLELFDQALLTRGAGIEFVERSPPALGPPVCQICGDEIESDLVNCRSCKTPHHRECWVYYGACSTYGCGEKRYAGK